MSFVNKYRSTTVFGELKVQKYNTGNIAGLLDVSGTALFRGDLGVNGNIYATDGTVDISGNLNVSGNIIGNVTGNVTGNLSGTSTNAINVTIATDSSNQSFFPTFVSATTGNLPLKVDAGISYNPFLNILSCDLSGNVSGNLTGTATNATNATNVTIATDSSNQSFFPTFVSATTGNLPLKVDGGITYNPSLNILSCDVSGNVTGNLLGTTIDVGNTNTSTINIEGGTSCEINIGVASILNTVNIGNNLSAVNITCAPEDAVLFFNPIDQMNGGL